MDDALLFENICPFVGDLQSCVYSSHPPFRVYNEVLYGIQASPDNSTFDHHGDECLNIASDDNTAHNVLAVLRGDDHMIFQGPTFVYALSMHGILAPLIFGRALPLNAGLLIFDGALLLDA